MTKILHIPSGTFANFVSSMEYDRTHPNNDGLVVIIEDSFLHECDESVDEIIKNHLCCNKEAVKAEFEVIYD